MPRGQAIPYEVIIEAKRQIMLRGERLTPQAIGKAAGVSRKRAQEVHARMVADGLAIPFVSERTRWDIERFLTECERLAPEGGYVPVLVAGKRIGCGASAVYCYRAELMRQGRWRWLKNPECKDQSAPKRLRKARREVFLATLKRLRPDGGAIPIAELEAALEGWSRQLVFLYANRELSKQGAAWTWWLIDHRGIERSRYTKEVDEETSVESFRAAKAEELRQAELRRRPKPIPESPVKRWVAEWKRGNAAMRFWRETTTGTWGM